MTTMPPQLREYRTMARVDIAALIERWRELHGLVSGSVSEECIVDLEAARTGFPQLLSRTADKLRGIFEQDSVVVEFQALAIPFTAENQSVLDARDTLAAAAMQRIQWLVKLQDSLDKFSESGRITVGGPR